MGQRSMKWGTGTNLCRQCHYTSVVKRGRVAPEWGVSCESCHGPGEPWLDIHHRPRGDPGERPLEWGDGRRESPSDRAARLSVAESKGLAHGGQWFDLASRCLQCHAVPHETLVNRGGHRVGSDFELLSWSSGEVRHSFLQSGGSTGSITNRSLSEAERCSIYLIGLRVDMRFTLGNLASISAVGGDYHMAMLDRARRLSSQLVGVRERISVLLFEARARAFSEQLDGVDLSALDDLLPTETRGHAPRSEGH